MKENHDASKKAIIAAIIGNSFWGFSFMASKTALSITPVIQLLSHRFLLAFLLMNLLAVTPLGDLHLWRKPGKPLWPLMLLGLFQPVIYFIGEQYGIIHSTTIFSGVMIAMIPIASILAAIPFLGEKPGLQQFFYCLLSVAGVVGIGLLTKSSGSLDWIGVFSLIVAVLAAVAYSLLSRRISRRYSPFERTYGMFGFGALVFTTMSICSLDGDLKEYVRPFKEPIYLFCLLFLVVCCSIISYFVTNYVLTKLTVARATVFANLTTVVSVLAGTFLLHEPFSPVGLLCCFMILLGIYGVQKETGSKEKVKEE